MSIEKFYWIGQRMFDGIIYSRVIKGLDALFCCDSCDLKETEEKKLGIFSLEEKLNRKLDWTSFSIDTIFAYFHKEIARYDDDGYTMFPYALPTYLNQINRSNKIVNWKVVTFNLPRTVQRMMLSSAGIPVPTWRAIDQNTTWETLKDFLGREIVVQYDNTSSGHGTFLVPNEETYKGVIKNRGAFPEIASVFIPSLPLSGHILIQDKEIVIANPSVQIIENREILGAVSFRYFGNDFSGYNFLNVDQKRRCKNVQNLVGSFLFNLGIRGLLGIDLLVTKDNVFVNEINFRLQNSTPFYTIIEMKNKLTPLICNLAYSSEPSKYSLSDGMMKGSQYILRSQEPHCIERVTSGIYSKKGKLLNDRIIPFIDVKEDEYLVISECGKSTATISKGAEIAKIYSSDSVLTNCGMEKEELSGFVEKLQWT